MKNIFKPVVIILVTITVLLQLGCGSKNDDIHPDVTATSLTLSGTLLLKVEDDNGLKLVKWPYGPAMIRADKLANAALTSDGDFNLILPQTMKGYDFVSLSDFAATLGGTCAATPSATAWYGPVVFMVDYTDNGVAKSMAVSQYLYVLSNNKLVIGKSYTYNFYDQDGTFKGNSNFNKSYDWTYTKGWGMLESSYSSVSGSFASKSIATLPNGVVWTN